MGKKKVLCILMAMICSYSLLESVEEGLHFSSKAISQASRAKAILESGENGLTAIEDLENLLKDPSFLRLDPQEKVQILFVLSKGYESFGRYVDQEKLLTTYANKRELYRFYIPLKVALVRSYIKQGRIAEADTIIKKIVTSSCGHLPLEEKREIASMLAFKDEYVFHLLKTGDRLMEGGNFSEALKKYKIVIECIENEQFPYQASLVEKRRIKQKVLLKRAEAFFSLGEYGAVVNALQGWDDRFFQEKEDLSCVQRCRFLLESSYQKIDRKEEAPHSIPEQLHDMTAWRALFENDGSFSKEYLLWLAHQAYMARSVEGLQLALHSIKRRDDIPNGFVKVLSGSCHALLQETVIAVDELCSGLVEAGPSESPWIETGHTLVSELGWQRVVLLLFSQQIDRARELAHKIISIIDTCDRIEHDLQKGLFYLFLHEIEKNPSHLSFLQRVVEKDQEPSSRRSLLLAYLENKPEEAYGGLEREAQTADRLFCIWLYRETELVNRYFWEIKELSSQDAGAPFWYYSRAIVAYQQAMCDEIGQKRALTFLYQALSLPSLVDVYPQLLHALVDLFLHSSQYEKAYELVQELMQTSSHYPSLTSLVLSCLVEFESDSGLEKEQETLCRYIFNRVTDVHSFAAALHMFEAKKQLFDHADPSLYWFERALLAQERARSYSQEIQQSKEPGIVKDKLEGAYREYEIARQHIFMAMGGIKGDETASFLWGTLFNLHRVLLDLLCEHLMTDSAFNELPDLIEEAVMVLRSDLELMPEKLGGWHNYLHPTLVDTCDVMAKTAFLCSKIFRGDEEGVLTGVREVIESQLVSPTSMRVALFLGKTLRKAGRADEEERVLSLLQERKIRHANSELALEIAIEKSLCFWELKQTDKAMAVLAWVINGPYASSLRVKAMIIRAELYVSLRRVDLAARQLESVVAKGGEWAVIAEGKLREIYGTG